MLFRDDAVRGFALSWYANRYVSDRHRRRSSTPAAPGSPIAGLIADVHRCAVRYS